MTKKAAVQSLTLDFCFLTLKDVSLLLPFCPSQEVFKEELVESFRHIYDTFSSPSMSDLYRMLHCPL